MTDPIILSALARGKPIAARRVQALADENAQLRAENTALNALKTLETAQIAAEALDRAEAAERELATAHKANEMARNLIRDLNGVVTRQRRVVDLARKWAAHDAALAEAMKEVYGDHL